MQARNALQALGQGVGHVGEGVEQHHATQRFAQVPTVGALPKLRRQHDADVGADAEAHDEDVPCHGTRQATVAPLACLDLLVDQRLHAVGQVLVGERLRVVPRGAWLPREGRVQEPRAVEHLRQRVQELHEVGLGVEQTR